MSRAFMVAAAETQLIDPSYTAEFFIVAHVDGNIPVPGMEWAQ